MDIGSNFTKANNNRQYSFAGKISYLSNNWQHKTEYNLLKSSQDNTENIEHIDWLIDTKRFIKNQWYLNANTSFLSNTEQGIKGRLTPSLSAGKYFFKTNKLYLLGGMGLTYNYEKYYDNTLDKNSTELLLGTQFNMFNFKNIDFYTNLTCYKSLSEKGRLRSDINLNLKFDLPYDFYLKTGIQMNYDNRPAIVGAVLDYVFTSGFGWELK